MPPLRDAPVRSSPLSPVPSAADSRPALAAPRADGSGGASAAGAALVPSASDVSVEALADPALAVPAEPGAVSAAAVYLASLAPGPGRYGMARVLARLAALLGHDGAERVRWAALRYPHMVALRAALRASGYAPATVNKHLAAVRGVLRHAWRLGQLSTDEYQRARDVSGVSGSRRPAGRALDQWELAALFRACDDGSLIGVRDAALFALLFSGGLRRAEASALDLDALDVSACTLTLVGKGNHERAVPLRGGARRALEAWLARRGTMPGPLVCRVRAGLVLSDLRLGPESVRARLRARALAAGLAHCSPHDLRRTFVTRLLDEGVDLALVGRMAGHRQVQTTARYDRRHDRAAEAAAERLVTPFAPDGG